MTQIAAPANSQEFKVLPQEMPERIQLDIDQLYIAFKSTISLAYESYGEWAKDILLGGKLNRALAKKYNQSPVILKNGFRGVTFCFDDFLKTAGETAAKILEDHGARGTFYTCFDLLGTDSPSGVIASIDMVRALSEKGHEIGCHTYDHINCSFVGGKRAAESCATNKKAAAAHGIRMDHFAYPQGGMSPAIKKVMKENFISARSILPGINRGTVDRHCLKSVPFYERYSHEDIFNRIDQVNREGGWLILYTHDVSANPSRYGVSEQLFQKAVSYCANKKIPIKTIGAFLNEESFSKERLRA